MKILACSQYACLVCVIVYQKYEFRSREEQENNRKNDCVAMWDLVSNCRSPQMGTFVKNDPVSGTQQQTLDNTI